MKAKISAYVSLRQESRNRLDAKYAGDWTVTGMVFKFGCLCGLKAHQGDHEITLRSSDFDDLVVELIP